MNTKQLQIALMTLSFLMSVGCGDNSEDSQHSSDADYDGWTVCGNSDGESSCDCDDLNSEIHPEAKEICDGLDNNCDGEADGKNELEWFSYYPDEDGDGYGSNEAPAEGCAPIEGYSDNEDDCDDQDPAINPAADERCNGSDDDCDGKFDEDEAIDGSLWHQDLDSDGFGNSAVPRTACEQPEGYVSNGDDCQDRDRAVNPDATETCDGIDNNCDGSIDGADASGQSTWYIDLDEDGFGDANTSTNACDPPTGYTDNDQDCDDSTAAANPSSSEICDGLDNDCDRTVDGSSATDATLYYQDLDGDGWGNSEVSLADCSAPLGYVASSGDCNDEEVDVHPEATEVCDGVDNNCNDESDEGFSPETYYSDLDSDGYGDPQAVSVACDPPVDYTYSLMGDDCDDTDANTYPGAEEACSTEIDLNCDGFLGGPDEDEDGYKSCQANDPENDCEDSDASIHPGATELCDEVDNDCDGTVDSNAVDANPYYPDNDNDGYGDPSGEILSCEILTGYLADSSDCDDSDASIHPDAEEVCDGADNNCNGEIDLDAEGAAEWYFDRDTDGFGDPEEYTVACDRPAGYVNNSTDCDDTNEDINPDAEELCDGLDDNCNGDRDDGWPENYFFDEDGDGFGGDSDGVCADVEGAVEARGDCDDADDTSYPGASDPGGDGIDQDCGGGSSAEPHVGLSEDSYDSIHAALDEASEGDIIWVGPGTYSEIDLTFDGKDLTLISTHLAAQTTIDAAQLSRAMVFESGESASSVLDGITFANGRVVGKDGGAIKITSSSPTIRNCAFTNNSASTGYGGAISFSGSSSSISDTTFSENVAGSGGALRASSSPLSIQDCTFIDNTGSDYGGAVYADNGSALSISGSSFQGNQATYGGGLYAVYSDPTVKSSSFSENGADFGGGLYGRESEPNISFCDFEGNAATDTGGGIRLSDASLTLKSSFLDSNIAEYGGGMGFLRTAGTISNCTISQNVAYDGGGINLRSSAPGISNCAIRDNSSTYAAAGITIYESNPTLSNCSISGNAADEFGGGILLYSSSPTLSNCVLSGNSVAVNSYGGGIYIQESSSRPTISNSIFAYNIGSNLFNSTNAPGNPALSYNDLYNPKGYGGNHNLSVLATTNLTVEPSFLSYDGDGLPENLHLSASSPLVNVGSPSITDVDGSPSDMGLFGGSSGDERDLDRDGYPDYFWPGQLEDAPEGFDSSEFDSDDQDSSSH